MRRSLIRFLAGLTILFLLPGYSSHAQTSTVSPYSRYGLGDLLFTGYPYQKAMGGVSIAMQDPLHLNFNNPASYAYDTITTVEFGIDAENVQLTQEGKSSSLNNSNLNAFSLGFPIIKNRLGFAFGFIPYSGTGYDVIVSQSADESTPYLSEYSGSGGLTRYYFGTGLRLTKHLAFGVNASYLFGTIDNTRKIEYVNPFLWDNKYTNELNIHSFYFELGASWSADLPDIYRDKIRYSFAVTGAPAQTMQAKNSELWVNYKTKGSIDEYIKDTVLFAVNVQGDVVLPMKLGVGFSLAAINKWVFGVDLNYQDWSQFTSYGEKGTLQNSYRVCIGGQYIPDAKSYNFFKRVSYRSGGHFGQTYLNVNNTPIAEFGISAGVGLPIKKSNQSMVSFTIEWSKRGTTENKLLKEQYFKFSIGLTINEQWFKKTKFD